MAQLGEEEVRREASSQPGQAAQDRDPGQAGDGGPRSRSRTGAGFDQEGDECCDDEEEEEEEGWRERRDESRQRGEELRGHGADGVKTEDEPPGFNPSHTPRPWRGQRSGVCVCVLLLLICVCVCPHPDHVCLSQSSSLDVIRLRVTGCHGNLKGDSCHVSLQDKRRPLNDITVTSSGSFSPFCLKEQFTMKV